MTDLQRALATLERQLSEAETRLDESVTKCDYMFARNSISSLTDLIAELSQ